MLRTYKVPWIIMNPMKKRKITHPLLPCSLFSFPLYSLI